MNLRTYRNLDIGKSTGSAPVDLRKYPFCLPQTVSGAKRSEAVKNWTSLSPSALCRCTWRSTIFWTSLSPLFFRGFPADGPSEVCAQCFALARRVFVLLFLIFVVLLICLLLLLLFFSHFLFSLVYFSCRSQSLFFCIVALSLPRTFRLVSLIKNQ